MVYNAIDLFAGCGGMTEGLFAAGYRVVAAVEIDHNAAQAYRANNEQRGVVLYEEDIRQVDPNAVKQLLGDEPLHLLAGCPPCQGFSTMRRKNKRGSKKDSRNRLIWEYVRFVESLMPITIMLENVPALAEYTEFKRAVTYLKRLGYLINYTNVNVARYSVPQRRKRLVLVGSLLGAIEPAKGNNHITTVRDAIGNMPLPQDSNDPLHQMFPHHTVHIQEQIRLTPHDGGSRLDLPEEYILPCHRKEGVGFKDVYGRLAWDKVSSTITGGCLNPSKGRFLHPEQDRCISAREAAMLQTFPREYIFPINLPRSAIALMIGNALPPIFCKIQAQNIAEQLDGIFMADVFDEKKRSEIMRKVKNKNTTPELIIRKLLCEMGYSHYRLQSRHLPCRPDIIYPGMKKAIFVNGCFWHGHGCRRGHLPETNHNYWDEKIHRNMVRDQENQANLEALGWTVLTIWQCEIKISNKNRLVDKLKHFMEQQTM